MSTNHEHGFRVLPTPADLPCTEGAPDSWDDRSADDALDVLLEVLYGARYAASIKAARGVLMRWGQIGVPTQHRRAAERVGRIISEYDARGDA